MLYSVYSGLCIGLVFLLAISGVDNMKHVSVEVTVYTIRIAQRILWCVIFVLCVLFTIYLLIQIKLQKSEVLLKIPSEYVVVTIEQ